MEDIPFSESPARVYTCSSRHGPDMARHRSLLHVHSHFPLHFHLPILQPSSSIPHTYHSYHPERPDMESPQKRRRVERSPSPVFNLDDNDDFKYIPVAQRKQAKLAKLTSWGTGSDKDRAARLQQEQEEREDEEREEERRKEKARKERTLLMEAQEVHNKKAEQGPCSLDFRTMFNISCGPLHQTRRRPKPRKLRNRTPKSLLPLRVGVNLHRISSLPKAYNTQNLSKHHGDHHGSFVNGPRMSIGAYARSTILLSRARIFLLQ